MTKTSRKGVRQSHGAYQKLCGLLGADVGQQRKVQRAAAIPTGVPSLDFCLNGGLPAGLVEVYGEESVGKTAFVAQVIKAAESKKMTALVASESCEVDYLRQLGVNLGSLFLIQGIDARTTLNAAIDFVTRADDRLLIIDTLSALHGSYSHEDWAGIKWQFFEEVSQVLTSSSCVLIISQVRHVKNPGCRGYFDGVVSESRRFSDLFSASLEFSRDEVSVTDYELEILVHSNAYSLPSQVVRVPVVKGHGIQVDIDRLRLAVKLGVLTQVGAWYTTHAGTRLGPGAEKAADQFRVDRARKQMEDALCS